MNFSGSIFLWEAYFTKALQIESLLAVQTKTHLLIQSQCLTAQWDLSQLKFFQPAEGF